jgi:transposase
MPKAYGIDFRKKILDAYLNKEGSIPEIAKRFKICESTVKRIARRHRETGEITLYLHHAGRHNLITEEGKKTLEEFLSESPDLSLKDLQKKFHERHGIKPVLTVFHNMLKKMNFSYKKKSHFASQRLRDDVKKKEINF